MVKKRLLTIEELGELVSDLSYKLQKLTERVDEIYPGQMQKMIERILAKRFAAWSLEYENRFQNLIAKISRSGDNYSLLTNEIMVLKEKVAGIKTTSLVFSSAVTKRILEVKIGEHIKKLSLEYDMQCR